MRGDYSNLPEINKYGWAMIAVMVAWPVYEVVRVLVSR